MEKNKPKSSYELLKEENLRLKSEIESLKGLVPKTESLEEVLHWTPRHVLLSARFFITNMIIGNDMGGEYLRFDPRYISDEPDLNGNYLKLPV